MKLEELESEAKDLMEFPEYHRLMEVNATTILEMIELIRMMKEALDSLYINDYSGYEVSKHEAHLIDEALAAVERWEKGESE